MQKVAANGGHLLLKADEAVAARPVGGPFGSVRRSLSVSGRVSRPGRHGSAGGPRADSCRLEPRGTPAAGISSRRGQHGSDPPHHPPGARRPPPAARRTGSWRAGGGPGTAPRYGPLHS